MREKLRTGLKLRDRTARLGSRLLGDTRAILNNAVRDTLEDRRVDIEILKRTADSIADGTATNHTFHLNRPWHKEVIAHMLTVRSGKAVRVEHALREVSRESGENSWEWHLS